jgi:hypothetical protein
MRDLLTGHLTITPTHPTGHTMHDPTASDPTVPDPTVPNSDVPDSDMPGPDVQATGAEKPDSAPADHGAGAAGPPPVPWRPTPVTPGKPLVQIVVPHTTLAGNDDQPVELIGYGPIPADLARTIAADAVWKRLVTDPRSGTLLDHGRNTYRPPTALSDFVRARDQVCRFPPCNRRAIDIELDHTISWTAQHGATADTNLYGGCAHHHHLKHDAPGWTVTQTAEGLITWTTPTGHSYTSEPYDYRPEPPIPATPARAARAAASPRPAPPDPWTLTAGSDDAPF